MENRPRITVVIPAFGRPELLSRAVRSALAEIGDGDEVLVVDDGSEPPVALPSQSGLRIIRSDRNRGAAATRNLGVADAATPLIAFLDSDDEWLPGKLAAQRRLFSSDNPDPLLAVSCGWLDTRNGVPFRGRIPRPSNARTDFFGGNWFAPGSTLLIARSAFALAGPFAEDLQRLEDYEWFLRFGLAGGRLAVVPAIGARIAAGRNARLPAVAASAEEITRRYSEDDRVTATERRFMAAWLHLNLALGGRNDRDWGRFAADLIRSFWLSPRARLQLEEWWYWVPVSAEKSRR